MLKSYMRMDGSLTAPFLRAPALQKKDPLCENVNFKVFGETKTRGKAADEKFPIRAVSAPGLI